MTLNETKKLLGSHLPAKIEHVMDDIRRKDLRVRIYTASPRFDGIVSEITHDSIVLEYKELDSNEPGCPYQPRTVFIPFISIQAFEILGQSVPIATPLAQPTEKVPLCGKKVTKTKFCRLPQGHEYGCDEDGDFGQK